MILRARLSSRQHAQRRQKVFKTALLGFRSVSRGLRGAHIQTGGMSGEQEARATSRGKYIWAGREYSMGALGNEVQTCGGRHVSAAGGDKGNVLCGGCGERAGGDGDAGRSLRWRRRTEIATGRGRDVWQKQCCGGHLRLETFCSDASARHDVWRSR